MGRFFPHVPPLAKSSTPAKANKSLINASSTSISNSVFLETDNDHLIDWIDSLKLRVDQTLAKQQTEHEQLKEAARKEELRVKYEAVIHLEHFDSLGTFLRDQDQVHKPGKLSRDAEYRSSHYPEANRQSYLEVDMVNQESSKNQSEDDDIVEILSDSPDEEVGAQNVDEEEFGEYEDEYGEYEGEYSEDLGELEEEEEVGADNAEGEDVELEEVGDDGEEEFDDLNYGANTEHPHIQRSVLHLDGHPLSSKPALSDAALRTHPYSHHNETYEFDGEISRYGHPDTHSYSEIEEDSHEHHANNAEDVAIGNFKHQEPHSPVSEYYSEERITEETDLGMDMNQRLLQKTKSSESHMNEHLGDEGDADDASEGSLIEVEEEDEEKEDEQEEDEQEEEEEDEEPEDDVEEDHVTSLNEMFDRGSSGAHLEKNPAEHIVDDTFVSAMGGDNEDFFAVLALAALQQSYGVPEGIQKHDLGDLGALLTGEEVKKEHTIFHADDVVEPIEVDVEEEDEEQNETISERVGRVVKTEEEKKEESEDKSIKEVYEDLQIEGEGDVSNDIEKQPIVELKDAPVETREPPSKQPVETIVDLSPPIFKSLATEDPLKTLMKLKKAEKKYNIKLAAVTELQDSVGQYLPSDSDYYLDMSSDFEFHDARDSEGVSLWFTQQSSADSEVLKPIVNNSKERPTIDALEKPPKPELEDLKVGDCDATFEETSAALDNAAFTAGEEAEELESVSALVANEKPEHKMDVPIVTQANAGPPMTASIEPITPPTLDEIDSPESIVSDNEAINSEGDVEIYFEESEMPHPDSLPNTEGLVVEVADDEAKLVIYDEFTEIELYAPAIPSSVEAAEEEAEHVAKFGNDVGRDLDIQEALVEPVGSESAELEFIVVPTAILEPVDPEPIVVIETQEEGLEIVEPSSVEEVFSRHGTPAPSFGAIEVVQIEEEVEEGSDEQEESDVQGEHSGLSPRKRPLDNAQPLLQPFKKLKLVLNPFHWLIKPATSPAESDHEAKDIVQGSLGSLEASMIEVESVIADELSDNIARRILETVADEDVDKMETTLEGSDPSSPAPSKNPVESSHDDLFQLADAATLASESDKSTSVDGKDKEVSAVMEQLEMVRGASGVFNPGSDAEIEDVEAVEDVVVQEADPIEDYKVVESMDVEIKAAEEPIVFNVSPQLEEQEPAQFGSSTLVEEVPVAEENERVDLFHETNGEFKKNSEEEIVKSIIVGEPAEIETKDLVEGATEPKAPSSPLLDFEHSAPVEISLEEIKETGLPVLSPELSPETESDQHKPTIFQEFSLADRNGETFESSSGSTSVDLHETSTPAGPFKFIKKTWKRIISSSYLAGSDEKGAKVKDTHTLPQANLPNLIITQPLTENLVVEPETDNKKGGKSEEKEKDVQVVGEVWDQIEASNETQPENDLVSLNELEVDDLSNHKDPIFIEESSSNLQGQQLVEFKESDGIKEALEKGLAAPFQDSSKSEKRISNYFEEVEIPEEELSTPGRITRSRRANLDRLNNIDQIEFVSKTKEENEDFQYLQTENEEEKVEDVLVETSVIPSGKAISSSPLETLKVSIAPQVKKNEEVNLVVVSDDPVTPVTSMFQQNNLKLSRSPVTPSPIPESQPNESIAQRVKREVESHKIPNYSSMVNLDIRQQHKSPKSPKLSKPPKVAKSPKSPRAQAKSKGSPQKRARDIKTEAKDGTEDKLSRLSRSKKDYGKLKPPSSPVAEPALMPRLRNTSGKWQLGLVDHPALRTRSKSPIKQTIQELSSEIEEEPLKKKRLTRSVKKKLAELEKEKDDQLEEARGRSRHR